MEIEVRTEENRAVLTLRGDVTSTGDLTAIQETVNDLLRKGVRHFTLNLMAVPYIDSAGLGQLVRLFVAVSDAGGTLELDGLTKRLTGLLRRTKLLERPEQKNFFMGLPDPFGARLPLLTPVIWLALLVTFVILVTIASRVSFSVW